MADKTITVRDYPGSAHIEQVYHDNGDGTYSPVVHLENDGLEVSLGTEKVILGEGTDLVGKFASRMVVADVDITQIVAVTTAGTPVQGPDKASLDGWFMIAHPSNVGTNMWFMFHGQTKVAKGYPVTKLVAVPLVVVNLSDLDFDADTSGDKLCFMKI